MISALISRVVILVFGTLYPAYSSYKAVKTKNVKEYVKWMMYWIVFALFTTVETFADVLISWFPFYYELKIGFVIWLLSPATKGASILYRKFVHPELMKREGEIDETIAKVKTHSYTALMNAGQQGLNIAVQGAMTGQARVFEQVMKKSWSVGDLSQQQDTAPVTYVPQPGIQESNDETDFPARQPVEQPPLLQSNPAMTTQWSEDPEMREITGDQMYHQPVIGDRRSQSGYNLRSHEYHSSTAHSEERDEMMHTNPQSSQPYHSNVVESDIKVELLNPEPQTSIPNTDPILLKPPAEANKVRRRRSRSRSAGRKGTASKRKPQTTQTQSKAVRKPVQKQVMV